MTQREESKLAGYAHLAYIVFAMSAAILLRKTTTGADTSQPLSTLRSTMALSVPVPADGLIPERQT